MSWRHALGGALTALPFIALSVPMVKSIGWKGAGIVWGLLLLGLAVAGAFYVGLWLLAS